jgi:hypothetical protein
MITRLHRREFAPELCALFARRLPLRGMARSAAYDEAIYALFP